jgi:hypothetical protein
MNLRDYLIDQAGKDWAQLLSAWAPPLLGGKYEIDNVEPTDLAVHYGLLADIYRQTKDLPDGTPIAAVVTDCGRGVPYLDITSYANDCGAEKT